MSSSRRNGFSFLSLLVAIFIGTLSLYGFSRMMSSTRATELAFARKLAAEEMAAELLEAFQSQTGTQILNYLKSNTASPWLGSYALCSAVNAVDRGAASSSPVILNPDPTVRLMPSILDTPAKSVNARADRFYVLQVVDITTQPPTPLSTHCGKSVVSYVPGNSSERLLVTVGVSFVPEKRSPQQAERIALSGIIAQW